MRVRTGLINGAVPASQQRQSSRTEDTMSEVTREEFEELRKVVAEMVDNGAKMLELINALPLPERTFEPAPTTEPLPTSVIEVAFQNYVNEIVGQSVAELGPAGQAKLEEGWTFYLCVAAEEARKKGLGGPSPAAIARCLVMAWREGRMADVLSHSRATTLLINLVADVYKDEPEPKVWRPDPLGREKWQAIPAGERWFAVELAAQHHGGDGEIPPTPVQP